MKNLLAFGLIILMLISCEHSPKNEFTITGKISGKVPSKAYLQLFENGKPNVIDSADFVNGEFKFKGKVASPDLYYIRIGDNRNMIAFFLENSNITITSHVDSLQLAKISGSKIQDQYIAFNESKKDFDVILKDLYQEYNSTEDQELQKDIEIKYDSIDNLKTEFTKQYVLNNGNSVLAAYIIRTELVYSIDLADLEELTNALSPELKENKYARDLYTRIELLRKLQPGMPAPQFTQNDINGNPVSLDSFKGKYLLIDFWASWCIPCRDANPTVVAMFKKYSKKNFTILGISMDTKKENWLKAIEDDGLKWTQVSSLEGWSNPVGKLFAVNSIPHAVLIDPDGNIVIRGVHANELDELLGSLLK